MSYSIITNLERNSEGTGQHSAWRSTNRGFTLLDLLIVIGIVLILATISVQPIRQGIQAYKVDQAINLTLSKLERARSLAQSRNTIAEVQLNSEAGTIQIVDTADRSNNAEVALVLETGVSLKEMPKASIRFFPRGYARGGTITLGDDYGHLKSITITASGSMEVSEASTEEARQYHEQ